MKDPAYWLQLIYERLGTAGGGTPADPSETNITQIGGVAVTNPLDVNIQGEEFGNDGTFFPVGVLPLTAVNQGAAMVHIVNADGDTPVIDTPGGISEANLSLGVHDAVLGTTGDAAVSTDANGTISAKLRGIIVNLVSLLARFPATLGQKVMASSFAVTIASDQSAVPVTVSSLPATTTVSVQVTKTVAATGTPEVLAADGTFFLSATLIGKRAARTNNTGIVYLGIGITNDTQALEIAPGEVVQISAPAGQRYDLNDWGLDVLNAGDGVIIIYS